MGDRRFSLTALAEMVGGRVRGDEAVTVTGVQTLEAAGPEHLSFLHAASFAPRAARSAAAALMVPESALDSVDADPRPLIVVDDGPLALARLLEQLHPRRPVSAGVHATAVVGEDVVVGDGVSIGPYAVIGDGSRLGAGCEIGAHVAIGRDCELGDSVRLHPHAVLYDGCRLGDRVEVHAGTVVGSDGFGYVLDGGKHRKVPQVGRAVIESDVEIGALTAIDRAALEETRIGTGSKIDNLVQVGHNTVLGQGCIVCGQAGLAGTSTLGDYVVLAGQTGVGGHLEIGSGTQVAARSAVLQSVGPGQKVGGTPAIELSKWRRQSLLLPKLPELSRRLRRVERALEAAQTPTAESPTTPATASDPEISDGT